ncbi:hypothetical protein [Polaromonas aquatica]|uniref:hypothetical protein n=1 Tax=Polaromonas aquatica TaxID=332657 RepID=UPI003D65284C
MKTKIWLPLLLLTGTAAVAFAMSEAEKKEREAADRICQAQLYTQAADLERRKEFAASYRSYSYLCDGVFYSPPAGQERSCDAAARLSKRFGESYEEAMTAVVAYRAAHGAYPASFEPVLGQLTPATREMVEKFDYCVKANPGDRTAKCTSGSQAFISKEVIFGTGQYGSVSFDLNRGANKPSPQLTPSCARVAG